MCEPVCTGRSGPLLCLAGEWAALRVPRQVHSGPPFVTCGRLLPSSASRDGEVWGLGQHFPARKSYNRNDFLLCLLYLSLPPLYPRTYEWNCVSDFFPFIQCELWTNSSSESFPRVWSLSAVSSVNLCDTDFLPVLGQSCPSHASWVWMWSWLCAALCSLSSFLIL